eukprot:Hpha_TRINITY_DN6823_c0_g1::TRINITY_DN6823_c0_g1_i1::g.46256::m.46256
MGLGVIPRVRADAELKSFAGRLRVEFTAGGSDYMWIGFVDDPRFDATVKLTTPDLPLLKGVEIPEVTRAISDLLRAEIREAIVWPRMEDVFIPLIDEPECPDETFILRESSMAWPPPSPPPTPRPKEPEPLAGASQPQPSFDDEDETTTRTRRSGAEVVRRAAGTIANLIADVHATAQGQQVDRPTDDDDGAEASRRGAEIASHALGAFSNLLKDVQAAHPSDSAAPAAPAPASAAMERLRERKPLRTTKVDAAALFGGLPRGGGNPRPPPTS